MELDAQTQQYYLLLNKNQSQHMKKLLKFLFKKRLYTASQVINIINDTQKASILGTFDYIQSKHVFIKQKSSGKHIKNAELSRDNDKEALVGFVRKRLESVGIEIKGAHS